jgi:hypothetical protein
MQFYFTVHGPSTHLFGKDGLKVCFEKDEDAQQWREAFRETISHLSTDMVGRHISTDMATRSPSTSTFQESPLGRERANSSTNLTPASSPGSEAFMDHSNLAKVYPLAPVPFMHAEQERATAAMLYASCCAASCCPTPVCGIPLLEQQPGCMTGSGFSHVRQVQTPHCSR